MPIDTKNQTTYWEDVVDSFYEIGVGPAVQDIEIRQGLGQKGVLTNIGPIPFYIKREFEPDPNYIWYDEENMIGFDGKNGTKDYRDYFADQNITNAKEHEVLKQHILRNEARAARMANSDRWTPAVVSALLQPTTYTPLALTKGIAYIPNVIRGAAIGSGIIGVDEISRHYYNPLATSEQTIAYMSGGALFGGILGGIGTGLKRAMLNKQKNAIIYNKKSDNAEIEEYLKKAKDEDGGIPVDFDLNIDGVTKTITRGTTGNSKNYTNSFGNRIEIDTGRNKTDRRILSMMDYIYNPIRYYIKDGKEFVDVDEAYIHIMFERYMQDLDVFGIPDNLKPILRNKKQFTDFLIRREVVRDINRTPATGKTLRQSEEELSNEIAAEAIRKGDMDYTPDFGDMADGTIFGIPYAKILGKTIGNVAKTLDKLSPLGKQAALKSLHRSAYNKVNMFMHKLIGDYGTRNKFADRGISIDSSVMLRRDVHWGSVTAELRKEIDDAYILYETGMEESANLLKETPKGFGDIIEKNISFSNIKSQATFREPTDAAERSLKNKTSNFFNKVRNFVGRNKTEEIFMTRRMFNDYIGKLHVDEDFFILEKTKARTTKHVEALTKARNALIKFYQTFDKEMIELGMKPTKETVKTLIEKIQKYNNVIETQLKKENLSQNQISILNSAKDLLKKVKTGTDDIFGESYTFTPPNEKPDTYMHRLWNIEAIEKNTPLFKKTLISGFRKDKDIMEAHDPSVQSLDDYLDKVADEKIDHILGVEAPYFDPDNTLPFTGSKKVAPLIHRTITAPNKDFINVQGIDFINTNSTDVATYYRDYMGTAIEMTREFGDRIGTFAKIDMMLEIAKKKSFKLNQANTAINNFESNVANLYGITNFLSPTSWSKQFVEGWRNYNTLTSMGSVTITSLPEIARPVAVHGLGKFFGKDADRYTTALNDLTEPIRKQILEEQSWLYTYMELQSINGGFARTTTSADARLRYTGPFKKIGNALRDIQRPFYFGNGLTQYTGILKNWQAGISSHRFIEDAILYASGKLKKADEKRFTAYGLDKTFAKTIKNLVDDGVIQQVSEKNRAPLYLANVNEWSTKKGGTDALRRFRQAIRADVERTIVTPSLADKYNMMHGKIVLNSEAFRKILGSNALYSKIFRGLLKGVGSEVTNITRGVVVSNAFMVLPLQFMAWTIAANRKITASGLAERDRSYMSYVVGSVIFAHLANTLKYSRFNDKPIEEQLLFDFENSGSLIPLTETNRIIENLTIGEQGIRPYFNMKQMFGPKDEFDMFGQIGGVGVSKALTLYDALDGTSRDLSFAIRQLMVFQNVYWLKGTLNLIDDMTNYRDNLDTYGVKDMNKFRRQDRYGDMR